VHASIQDFLVGPRSGHSRKHAIAETCVLSGMAACAADSNSHLDASPEMWTVVRLLVRRTPKPAARSCQIDDRIYILEHLRCTRLTQKGVVAGTTGGTPCTEILQDEAGSTGRRSPVMVLLDRIGVGWVVGSQLILLWARFYCWLVLPSWLV